MRFGWPGAKPTESSCGPSSPSASITTRAASAPKWTSSRSLVVRFDQPRPQRADQLQQHVAFLDRLESITQELGVEADLQRLALEGHRQRLPSLADVGRLGRDRELAGGEGQAQRGVLLGQEA